MSETQNPKRYDLEDRALAFARRTRALIRRLPRTVSNREDAKQLVRASGSVGANYIEANESLSKKDFVLRIKICRKEAKESAYWLKVVDTAGEAGLDEERAAIIREAGELVSILGAILQKSR